MEYKVVHNDTLGKIANRNGTTIEAILKANPKIKNPGVITVGQRLTIPTPLMRTTTGGGPRPTTDRSAPGPSVWDSISLGLKGFVAEISSWILTPAFEITGARLKKIFDRADDGYLERVATELNRDLEKCALETPLRCAHFFAQAREETGRSLEGKTENLEYGPEALLETFGYYKKNKDEAEEDGYERDPDTKKITRRAKQEDIANKAYGNRMGNGNAASGDGWRYRGRGFFQITGKDGYKAVSDRYKVIYGDSNVDFVAKPELLEEFPYSVRSAVCYWINNGLPKIADKGDKPETVDEITKVINEKTKSYADRRSHFKKAWEAFK